MKYADGSVYEGDIEDFKKQGNGKLTNADGTILHDGKWDEDKP